MKKNITVAIFLLFCLLLTACEAFKVKNTSEGADFFKPTPDIEVTNSLSGLWVSDTSSPHNGQHRFAIKINTEKNTFALAKECTHKRVKDLKAYAFVEVDVKIQDATQNKKGFLKPQDGGDSETVNQQGLVKITCSVTIRLSEIFRFDRRKKIITTFYEENSEENLQFFKISDL